jgi:16S rRNA (uracil1498-N3)-methyltransferase
MTRPTVQIPTLDPEQSVITLTGPHFHYLVRVRRIAPGYMIRALDDQGQTALLEVTSIAEDHLVLAIRELVGASPVTHPLTIVCSPLKNRRTPEIVANCAELGVERLVLVHLQRTVARFRSERLERLTRVAREAARRVSQPRTTEIELVAHLDQAITASTDAQRYFLWEDSGSPLTSLPLQEPGERVLFIGPEGGFAPEEVTQFQIAGIPPVRFNGPAYQASTAIFLAATLFMHHMGRI